MTPDLFGYLIVGYVSGYLVGLFQLTVKQLFEKI
jgi:hypothetical protein